MALRIASVNTNGVRASFRKGMGDWLAARNVDILAMQEVRASTEDLEALLGPEWDILHDPATAKGRAGVAIASRQAFFSAVVSFASSRDAALACRASRVICSDKFLRLQ